MQSSSRNGAKVRLLAVHTTEGIMRVGDLRAFFDRPTAAGSSHASADDTGALAGPESGFVPYDRAAWTLRNGNPVSENLEYCGWARYTRQEWLARPNGLEAIARWLTERHKARGVPLVKLSPADVAAGKSGVIGHNDWTVGMKDGTHWDPGTGFPWDVVLARANQLTNGDDDMPLTDADVAKLLDWTVRQPDGGTRTLSEMIAADTGYGTRIERIDEGAHGGWGYGRRIENIETVLGEIREALAALTAKNSGTGGTDPGV